MGVLYQIVGWFRTEISGLEISHGCFISDSGMV